MLSIHFIREDPEAVRKAIADKGVDLDLDRLLELDRRVVALIRETEGLAAEKNALSRSIKKASKEERPGLIARSKELGGQKGTLDEELKGARADLAEMLWRTPNIPFAGAPVGPGADDNVVLRQVGDRPAFPFEPRDHVELIRRNGWGEFDRVTQVSGSRTYALKGDLARLELALHLWVLDKLADRGFTSISVPALASEEAFYGTGHFPGGVEDAYHLPADEKYLAGTAEIVLTSLHRGEIQDGADLPIRYAGFSSCFRREAGSFGRDVRGLLRVHQFLKVEQYVICRNDPEESARWHAELLDGAEEVLRDLELPYQVIECSTGDMGLGKVRMNDLETWVPSLGKYRETHSCSTLHEWQARRANLRYRDEDGKVRYVHTLNNTGLATPRLLAPLLENHQHADGGVRLPEAIRPYMGGRERLEPAAPPG
ncbi:MAG: serine--tRNA ligase [Sandaracinaceae bacterium]